METITINGSTQKYAILAIRPVSEHVLQLVMDDADDIPDEWGDITVYTDGGYQCAYLSGYDTVYRDDGQTIYLSNDGSVYKPPADMEPILPPAPYVPTEAELLEAAQASKKAEISEACEQMIYRGVNVTLTDGNVEHFSLTEHDQINLFGKQVQLAAGAEQLEYHADGQPCRYYSVVDMQAIIQTAMFHVSYHTTYCNALNMWIAGCETKDDIQQIFYGADIPEAYQSEVLKAYLLQIAK